MYFIYNKIKRNPMLWSSWEALLKCLPKSKDKFMKVRFYSTRDTNPPIVTFKVNK